jgi:hypothetical protein
VIPPDVLERGTRALIEELRRQYPGVDWIVRDGEWLPVAEAAVRFGCTPNALRKRVARGTAKGHRTGRRLEVWVPLDGDER